MKKRHEFKFRVSAYTPETLPMARLADYLGELAKVLGHDSAVHFVRIEKGSVVPVIAVDREEVPKVLKRVADARRGEGPAEAREAVSRIDRWLADDDANADLVGPTGAKLLRFPGRDRATLTEFGPFTQAATLDGVVIVVGGKSDPVPVHLQDGEIVHNCVAARPLARQLAAHIFGTPLRVSGTGRWLRDATGRWEMKHFAIASCVQLTDEDLSAAVERLRAVPGDWKSAPDPLNALMAIRKGEREH